MQINDVVLVAVLWYPQWFALIIATYLFFFDKHIHKVKKDFFKRHLKYFIAITFIFALSFFIIFMGDTFLKVPFAYVGLITPFVIFPLALFVYRKHWVFFKTFLPTTLLLFYPMFLYDIIGVYTGQWIFDGEYLYTINFWGSALPIEEFVVWLWIAPASVIAYFEEFESNS